MAGIILLFSATDDISSSLFATFMRDFLVKASSLSGTFLRNPVPWFLMFLWLCTVHNNFPHAQLRHLQQTQECSWNGKKLESS